MPSVRTDNQPIRVANTAASTMANDTASHHGQARLMAVAVLVPRIATRYPAMPATDICASDTMPP